MYKALVTGANGFIGSHLVESLLAKGYHVTCLVRPTSDLSWLKDLKVKLVTGDITERESLIYPINESDHIFHLGGLTKAVNESTYHKVNADGARNVFEECLAHNPNVKKIVHVSSLAAAGPAHVGRPRIETDLNSPLTYYGKSKLEGEKHAVQYSKQLPITIIRPPAVYGPREKDIFFHFQLINNHVMPILGWNTKYLSLVYVKDLVNAIILAAESPQSNGQTYYVDDGHVYSWKEFGAAIQKSTQGWTLPVFVPEFFITIAALISEGLTSLSGKPALLNLQKIIELKQTSWATSSSKIRKELGFVSHYDLEKGCRETVEWYRNHGRLK